MCFGGKARVDGGEPARPAKQLSEARQDGKKTAAPSSAVPSYVAKGTAAPSEEPWYAPPAGPPPSEAPAPPSHAQTAHDWEAAVPDTSLFPPPPALFSGHDASPVNNATGAEAEAGEAWCAQHPLAPPMEPQAVASMALRAGNIRLMEPAGFGGTLSWLAPGHWRAATPKASPDRCIIGYPPLYLARDHDAVRPGRPKTIYYEVRILGGNSVALGFTALPYPSFRLPGWHRGSLGVHSDDGRRYINDRWGGKDFTREFRRGETLGVGMTFAPSETSIFFTRDGVRAGGWDLHEETDAEQDLPVTGLEGFHDLSCAIGVFDAVDVEVVFDEAKWRYRPG
ncbi:hypothetical protein E4U42_001075 [Claviceps africana]|uniref:SPRY domain-containing protein n=1 Tax=Claviceps africana TaxID=83212 RepID=A0A8K0J9W4_9HYPO|nr:hypothetical protein E4U42_001075 [Claviceps africana]